MRFQISRRGWLMASVALLAMVLFACGKGSDTTAAGGDSGVKPLRLAFVTNNSSSFWTIAHAGVDKAQKEVPNITVDFREPQNAQAGTQKSMIEDMLASGIDGLAISVNDPTNMTSFLNEAASKAMVVTQDSDAPDSNRTVYIGTDNQAAGKQAGELLMKALPNGGKVMLFVGNNDAQNSKDRLAGIKDAIKGSKIELLGDPRTDQADSSKAKANAADAIAAEPDLAAMVGLYSYNGPAILNAVRDAKQNGKIKIVCFDEDPVTLEGVKAGDISGTVVQQPFEFGRQSVTVMAKYLRGDKSAVPASKTIIVPTRKIEQDNVDEFSKELAGYLGTSAK